MKQSYRSTNKYFAADKADKTVAHLMDKAEGWFNTLIENSYLDKIQRSWRYYYGIFHDDNYGGHEVYFDGEQGELVQVAVNHYRNIAKNMLVMVTSTRPVFQPRSVNTDHKSLAQTELAQGLLEYYMRDKNLEDYIKKAVEYAIVMSSGFIKMEWNGTSGEVYDYIDIDEERIVSYDEEGNPLDENDEILEPHPIYEGDVEFSNLSPLDVVFDTSKDDYKKHNWVLTRSFKNKFDLAAKFPELEDKIKKLKTKDEEQRTKTSLIGLDETQDVAVYEFFHVSTEALPGGRYIMYLDEDIILMDTPMPYRRLPVYRISPADLLGTPYGYTTMFDLLPLQETHNSLTSTIMTNQNAFGVQNIYVPRGADISVNQLEGALNIIEGNPGAGKPEPLNLTATPAEVFNFMQQIERSMEVISGVNSVARGNPEASLRSGNALALVQAQALQFVSGLQQSYIRLIEDVGTGLIHLLQDYANVPRIAAIAGKSKKTLMKEFTRDDIDSINRVVVDVGNALSQTTAGKVQMAEQMLQMGLITSPEQYFSVINTGKLETMTLGAEKENLLIADENERLIQGQEVVATALDNHDLHIREHRNVLRDSDLRFDPELVARTLAHIQEHINLLRTTDPDLLAILQEQPLGPPQGSAISPQNAAPGQPAAPGQAPPSSMMNNPEAQSLDALQNQNLPMPQPAQPPAGFEGLPQTPQQLFNQNTGG